MPVTGYGATVRVVPEVDMSSQQAFSHWEKMFFQMLKDTGVNNIRVLTMSGMFKHPTGNLAASIRGKISGKAVLWWSDAPYAPFLEKGVRPHTMWHLLNKTVPITLYKFGSETKIYRRATMKALMSGKFFHPGFHGKHFMRRGVEMTLDDVPKLLMKARKAVLSILPQTPRLS